MQQKPEPFNFYAFSPFFILAFLITHGKREIGDWLGELAWKYDFKELKPLADFMLNRSDFTFFSVFFITVFGSLFFMLWRFDVHCNRLRAYESQQRKLSN